MLEERIYLDYNATSPLRPEVRESIASFLGQPMGNPSSVHSSGRKARQALDQAREEVAQLLGAQPSEILFTSGGTEANHLAWRAAEKSAKQFVTTKVEHPSVLSAAAHAEKTGIQVRYLSPSEIETTSGEANFVSIQHANNETGILHPISDIVKKTKALFHTDAVQTFGKIPIQASSLGAHFLSMSGHKIGALAGTGALFIRKGTPYEPIWGGGHQEKGRRTGTENLLGIIAIGAACRTIREKGESENQRIENFRNLFEQEIMNRIPGVEITGSDKKRLPNTSNLSFEDVDGESLLIAADLEGIHCSTGAACSSGSLEPSHVLLAMGFSPAKASSSLRFSFGWGTTARDISTVIELLPKLVDQVRSQNRNMQRSAR